jgi:DNA-binding CsgD family transcriptional regulator
MPRKKITDTQKLIRQEKVWDLYVRGRTQRTIAKELKMPLPTVNEHIQSAHDRYRVLLDKDVKRYHEKHLSQLEHIAQEALKSWDTDLKVSKHGSQRDAAYLETAMRSIEQIRKVIYGKKQEEFAESDEAKDPAIRILEIVQGVKERMKSGQ